MRWFRAFRSSHLFFPDRPLAPAAKRVQ
jgi:hypothetical protein